MDINRSSYSYFSLFWGNDIIGCLAGYDSLYSLMCPPPASIIRGSMVEDNGNIRIISEYEAEEKYTVN